MVASTNHVAAEQLAEAGDEAFGFRRPDADRCADCVHGLRRVDRGISARFNVRYKDIDELAAERTELAVILGRAVLARYIACPSSSTRCASSVAGPVRHQQPEAFGFGERALILRRDHERHAVE